MGSEELCCLIVYAGGIQKTYSLLFSLKIAARQPVTVADDDDDDDEVMLNALGCRLTY